MKHTYLARTLFSGRSIDLDNDLAYVAIPDFEFKNGCTVWYREKKMTINKGTKPTTYRHQYQQDEVKRANGIPYIVGYFVFVPDIFQEVEEPINAFEPTNKEHINRMLEIKAKIFGKVSYNNIRLTTNID